MKSGVTPREATLVGVRRRGNYRENTSDLGSRNELSFCRGFTRRRRKSFQAHTDLPRTKTVFSLVIRFLRVL